jgi:hypothetical protein
VAGLWDASRVIPRGPTAVLNALDLAGGSAEPLRALRDEDWRRALVFSDRAQLTLLLGQFVAAGIPDWVRDRLSRNVSDNASRIERLREAYLEIALALAQARAEFVVLKGFAQAPAYVADLRYRVQYDVDLFCPPGRLSAARNALARLGYSESGGLENLPLDHLPTMIRWTDWTSNGNYFDPNMPLAVDLHFRFWDRRTERFDAPGVERFWERRTVRNIGGRDVPILDPADALAYASLHALRHLLRGSVKAFHLYEIAYFLQTHRDDGAFWDAWCDAHSPPLRRLQGVCFRVAQEWFGCRLPAAAQEEIDRLPTSVDAWFARAAASPVEALFRPNKDELWLHLCLVESLSDKANILRRRLLPARLPPADETENPQTGLRQKLVYKANYAAQVGRRTVFHLRATLPTLWWPLAQIGRPFWVFLGAASLFNFGLFVFFLLYNLHLLELGYKEDVLGRIAGAMTAGSIAGTLPAGALVERLRLRGAILASFAGVGVLSAIRSVVSGEPALLATAFLSGVAMSLWAVSIPPAVAQLTTERSRPFGFSVVFATGIGMGVVGGLAGGRLPALLGSKEAALLVGSASMALALVPAARLRFAATPGRKRVRYPRNGFVLRFLAAIALWSFAVGSFNPFFSAYFATHLRASTDRIGSVFSASQLAQVAAVLLSPLVLRKLGIVRGIAGMQIATAVALAALAGGPTGWAAGAAYAAYMSFQYMSEPGLYSLLMSGVAKEEQSGASALNFLVVFSVQAVAVTLAGSAYARFGYPPVLGAAACVALVAALLFGWICSTTFRTSLR